MGLQRNITGSIRKFARSAPFPRSSKINDKACIRQQSLGTRLDNSMAIGRQKECKSRPTQEAKESALFAVLDTTRVEDQQLATPCADVSQTAGDQRQNTPRLCISTCAGVQDCSSFALQGALWCSLCSASYRSPLLNTSVCKYPSQHCTV